MKKSKKLIPILVCIAICSILTAITLLITKPFSKTKNNSTPNSIQEIDYIVDYNEELAWEYENYGTEEYWKRYADTEEGKKMANTPSYIEGYSLLDLMKLWLPNEPGSDIDGDGLTDEEELTIYHSNPSLISSSGDLFSDAYKAAHQMDLNKTYTINDAPDDFNFSFINNIHEAFLLNPKNAQDVNASISQLTDEQLLTMLNKTVDNGYAYFLISGFSGEVSIDLSKIDANLTSDDINIYISSFLGNDTLNKIDFTIPDKYINILTKEEIKNNKKSIITINYEFPYLSQTIICIKLDTFSSFLSKFKNNLLEIGSGVINDDICAVYFTSGSKNIFSWHTTTKYTVYYTSLSNNYYINDYFKRQIIDSIISDEIYAFDDKYFPLSADMFALSIGNLDSFSCEILDYDTKKPRTIEIEFVKKNFAEVKTKYELLQKTPKFELPFYLVFDFKKLNNCIDVADEVRHDSSNAPKYYPYTSIISYKSLEQIDSYIPEDLDKDYFKNNHKRAITNYGYLETHIDGEYRKKIRAIYSAKEHSDTGFTSKDILPFKNTADIYGATGLCSAFAHLTSVVFNTGEIDHASASFDVCTDENTKQRYTKITNPNALYVNDSVTIVEDDTYNVEIKKDEDTSLATFFDKGLSDYKTASYTNVDKNASHFYKKNGRYFFGKDLSNEDLKFLKLMHYYHVLENRVSGGTKKTVTSSVQTELMQGTLNNPEQYFYPESVLKTILDHLNQGHILDLAFSCCYEDGSYYGGHSVNIINYEKRTAVGSDEHAKEPFTNDIYIFILYDNNVPELFNNGCCDGLYEGNGVLIIYPFTLNDKTYFTYTIKMNYNIYPADPYFGNNHKLLLHDWNFKPLNKAGY